MTICLNWMTRRFRAHEIYDPCLSPHLLLRRFQREDETFRMDSFNNRFDCFIRWAGLDGRLARLLFDPAFYRAQLDDAEATAADVQGAFSHFLRRLVAGKPELRTSTYFDPGWYLCRYPEIAGEIGSVWPCALHHYLSNSTPRAFDPLPEFSEAAYRERYPDVAAAVEAGDFRNGYEHFLFHGISELRSPADGIDLSHCVSADDSVLRDLEAGHARDVFAHLLQNGCAQGLPATPMTDGWEEERSRQCAYLARIGYHPDIARHEEGEYDVDPGKLVFSHCGGSHSLHHYPVLWEKRSIRCAASPRWRQLFPKRNARSSW